MAERIDMLIIDPQVDFCDPNGALFVPGATEDMKRVSEMIDRFGDSIDKIHVTMDSHHLIDIAHPGMWRNGEGKNPDPFTIIGSKDIKEGTWFPVYPSLRQRFIEYCETLEEEGKYSHCIWNPHCLIGSKGGCVIEPLYNSLLKWETKKKNNVDYVSKGSNIFSEHFSALKAQVPDPEDSFTQLNTRLITTLSLADKIIICGEAGSHCLKSSVEDIVSEFNDDSYVKKITLLTDGTSPVISPFVNFPEIQQQFIEDMKKRGMKVAKTTDF